MCVCVCVYIIMCVCVCERERERKKERKREREREREREERGGGEGRGEEGRETMEVESCLTLYNKCFCLFKINTITIIIFGSHCCIIIIIK